jgi:hypothetical protein
VTFGADDHHVLLFALLTLDTEAVQGGLFLDHVAEEQVYSAAVPALTYTFGYWDG